MRIDMGYPGREAENRLLKGEEPKNLLSKMKPCLNQEDVMTIQEKISKVHISDALMEYLQDILEFTRTSPHFYMGLSPRAGMAILQAAKSWAFLNGRDFTLPEDIQHVLTYITGHRLRSKNDLRQFSNEELNTIMMEVPIP